MTEQATKIPKESRERYNRIALRLLVELVLHHWSNYELESDEIAYIEGELRNWLDQGGGRDRD